MLARMCRLILLPSVCVHGACVDGTFFDGIACELSRNYRVIAYDRRGCGGSSEAADGSYDLAAQVADLQAVIEHVARSDKCACA